MKVENCKTCATMCTQHVSDEFFYYELLRTVGQSESSKWLKSCEANAASPTVRSPKSQTTLRSCKPVPKLKETAGNEKMERAPSAGRWKEHEIFCSAPSDTEVTAESLNNIGLLFTDAAHTVLNDKETSRNLQRKKSCLF
jgi:hypothetical protein